ncbi:MAG: hypothetical protein AAF617_02945 [Bacteroidota bacterium]
MKSSYKTGIYIFFVCVGGGFLLFRDAVQDQTQLVFTIIAVCLIMFGLYKMSSSLTSNSQREYDSQEYFNREKYDQQETIQNAEEE